MMDEPLGVIGERVENLPEKASFAVSLRTVDRHRIVTRLLGPYSEPGKRLVGVPRGSDRHQSLDPMIRAAKPDAVTAGYLLRRTILELALAMARGRGLVAVAALAVDRCGRYYDAYRRYAGENPKTWRDLCELAGFKQNKAVPDIFEAIEAIRKARLEQSEKELYERLRKKPGGEGEDDSRELPRLRARKLAKRVIPYIVDSPSDDEIACLVDELKELRDGDEYEIHSRDDRVCSKTFARPKTLKTLSSFDAYSFDLIQQAGCDESRTEIDVISETGNWLLKHDGAFSKYLQDVDQIRLIVAFVCDVEKLEDKYKGITITLKYQQPWHHNRHMVIVKKDSEPFEAIYFARHHRTPYVTPVLVRRRGDIKVLEETFEKRWENSHDLEFAPTARR
jgi:hypothetical protein